MYFKTLSFQSCLSICTFSFLQDLERLITLHESNLKHPNVYNRSCAQMLRPVRPFVTPWTVVRQAPPSMGVSRQEYWGGFCFPPPGLFLTQGSNLRVRHRQVDSLPLVPLRTPAIFPTHVFFLNRLSYDSEPLFGPCLRKSRFQCSLGCFLVFIVLFVLLLSAARSHWH